MANEKKNTTIKLAASGRGSPLALPDNAGDYSLSKEQTINQPVLLELMIDEPLGSLHLVQMSGIRSIQGLAERRDIDCLISTVRPDSRSVLRWFLHLEGYPWDR